MSDRGYKGRPKSKTNKTSIKESADKAEQSTQESFSDKEEIRLNKFIANAGVCSRREADKLIADGLITVNGKWKLLLAQK